MVLKASCSLFFSLIMLIGLGAQDKADEEGKWISLECKVLEIKKSETILLSNPKVMVMEGKEAEIVQGKRIPVKRPSGETDYLEEKLEIRVVPRIIPEQGIELKIEVKIQKVDETTFAISQVSVNKIQVLGNLEAMVLELMENKEKKSRIVVQISALISPDPPQLSKK